MIGELTPTNEIKSGLKRFAFFVSTNFIFGCLDDGGTAGQAAGVLKMLVGYTKKLFEIPKNFKNFFKKNWNFKQKKRIPMQYKKHNPSLLPAGIQQ
jgi:hypothetical protein